MENAIYLPLDEESLDKVIETLSEALNYEATLAIMLSILEADSNDELKAGSSMFDRVTWSTRIAYMSGFIAGMDIYETASNEGVLFLDSITDKFEKVDSEEYRESIIRVSDYLNLSKSNHPVPQMAVSIEEELISPRRVTRLMGNGKIDVRFDNEFCLKKLWLYENTGFEPEDMYCRSSRPHIDIMKQFVGELPVGEEAKNYLILQELLDKVYEFAYATGRKEERESTDNL